MIDWNKGRATFDWESATNERTVHLPTEQVLALRTERQKELERTKEAIPSADAVFSIPVNSAGQDRRIPADQWSILALSNGARSVAEIAGMLGRNISEVSRAVCRMVEAGLLENVHETTPSPGETVHEDFIPTIEAELEKALGPVAQSIVDADIARLGESRSAFPQDRAQAFVKSIAEEISDEAKRAEFEQGVLEVSLREIESTYNLADLPRSPASRLLSVDEFCKEINSAGKVKTTPVESAEPNIEPLLVDEFGLDATRDTRPHTRRRTASFGYGAVILLVLSLGIAFVFTGRQANRPHAVETGPPAASKPEVKITAVPVPLDATAPLSTPAPVPDETVVAPQANPKHPALASRQPTSVKRSLSSNRERPATRYIDEGQRQYRDGNYMKAKQAFLQALASDPHNQTAAEGLENVRTAEEAEQKIFRDRKL